MQRRLSSCLKRVSPWGWLFKPLTIFWTLRVAAKSWGKTPSTTKRPARSPGSLTWEEEARKLASGHTDRAARFVEEIGGQNTLFARTDCPHAYPPHVMNDERRLFSRDWKERLSLSRASGKGFAAPGGEFTRALYEWVLTDEENALRSLLRGQRVVELGAGMMPFGYALGRRMPSEKNFVAVEPYYSDLQEISIQSFVKENFGHRPSNSFQGIRRGHAFLPHE